MVLKCRHDDSITGNDVGRSVLHPFGNSKTKFDDRFSIWREGKRRFETIGFVIVI